jgi:hypothetical protein
MAIKISGVTVITDNKEFIGDGSQLTNVLPAIAQPGNISPANGATGIGANLGTATLTGSGYLSLDGGFQMAAAQFQVSTVSNFASTVISTGDVAGTSTSYTFTPNGTLNVSTTYYWRLRYKDTNGSYSDWSLGTTFVTASAFELSLGTSYQGGIYIGKMVVSSGSTENIYGILLAPKASGQSSTTLQWKTTGTTTSGTLSLTDGFTNTNNMSNATHPAANYTAGLTISTYDDWYLPAKDELNLAWVNRASLPSGETNDATDYWSSSELNATNAWFQNFGSGGQGSIGKTYNGGSVRAVRRFSIQNLTLGTLIDGGYLIGSISVGGVLYGILLAPKASGQSSTTLQWKTTATTTSGTTSLVDGWTNTNNMNNTTHPAAYYTRGLNISGFTDWYLPAKDELNLAWVNRASLPSGETNDATGYWSSSESGATDAWGQGFGSGTQINDGKTGTSSVRAVRRFLI